jgi:hypothetical protein
MARKSQGIKCHCDKTSGEPCPNWAMHGQLVCAAHGGRSPQAKAAAEERQAEAEARKVLYKYDAHPVDNALEALQRLAGRALALEAAMGDMVNDLKSVRYQGGEGAEQLRGEVAVLERAMDRCGKILVDIARLNIDERLVKIEEGKAKIIVEAVEVALAAAGVRGQAAVEPKRAAARHLRAAS